MQIKLITYHFVALCTSNKYNRALKKIAFCVMCLIYAIQTISQVPVAVESIVQLKTIVSENPPSISFYWNQIPGNPPVYILRKNFISTIWNEIGRTQSGDTAFTDKEVQPEIGYEYRIAASTKSIVPTETYVAAGIKYRKPDQFNKIILLVDSMFVVPLRDELFRLELDLIGDGWEIIRKDISRNSSVKQVKDFIRETYLKDWMCINTLFLVGHIPVPYSGEYAFDGHKGEHEGAWPADAYYGIMDSIYWTDSIVYNKNSKYPENHNVPGDAKFDLSYLKNGQSVSLDIGRVDFYNLPALQKSEIKLMKNYLDKDHDYRHKKINPKMQALIDDNLPSLAVTDEFLGDTLYYEMISLSGWRNFTALFNFENVKTGKVFTDALTDSFIWTYGCGWGKLDECDSIGTSSDFATYSPKTVFTGFYGSWFGDWNTKDNFLRSALATNDWILTSCWSGRPHYVFHHMGMGETIGRCIRRTQNNYTTYYCGLSKSKKAIHISLMGDPTLRMHMVGPVENLNAENHNNAISLNWKSPDDEIIGYYVYRQDNITNKFEQLNKEFITDTFYTDDLPQQGNNYYMVRALQLTQTASGSYYNLSQGIFDTIKYVTDVSTIYTRNGNVLIYPNPTNKFLTIETGISDIYNINITSINGQLLLNKVFVGVDFKIDLSAFQSGIYLVTIRSKDFITTRKIVKQ